MKKLFTGLLVVMTVMLFGCGDGSSGSAPKVGSVATKGIIYPVVEGLSYQTNSSSGVVASDGSYTYKANENVTFSAGGIELATAPAGAKVTPLPLDNDVASINLLRLLKALDTDGDLSNGILLSQMATSTLTSVDLTSETSVAAALASLKPAAILPAASDVQVATALANTKTTALQNMGTYGSTYKAIRVTQHNGSPLPGYPKNAVINLTSQPNWTTGAITGTAILTLNDNSTVTLPFNNTNGNYTASGVTFAYSIVSIYGGKSRVIALYVGLATQEGKSVGIVLRDDSQPNIPPAAAAYGETTFPLSSNVPRVTTLSSIPSDQGIKMLGSWDTDGIVVSQVWTSSKGKTGTGNTFSEGFLYNEKGSITLTVTDDEGATASKTWQYNSDSNAAFTSSMLSGKTVTTDGISGKDILHLNANGTWTGINSSNEQTSGTWNVDSSGRFVVVYEFSPGEPYETQTWTIKSGSLPTFNASMTGVNFDEPAWGGSGTVTITGAVPTNTGSITVGW